MTSSLSINGPRLPAPSYASNHCSIPSIESDAISISSSSSSGSSIPIMEFWNEGVIDPDLYWFNDEFNQLQQNDNNDNNNNDINPSTLQYPLHHQHNNNDHNTFVNDGISLSTSSTARSSSSPSSNWMPNYYPTTPMLTDNDNDSMRVDSHHMIDINNSNIDHSNDHNNDNNNSNGIYVPSTNIACNTIITEQRVAVGVGLKHSCPPPPRDKRQPSTSTSKHNRNKPSHKSSTTTTVTEQPLSTLLDNSHPSNTPIPPKVYVDMLNAMTKTMIFYLKEFEVYQSQHSTPCYFLNHILSHTASGDQNRCKEILLEIGYTLRKTNATTTTSNINDDNIYTNNTDYTESWRHPNPAFPYITFPYDGHISWTSSPDTCIEEPDNVLSFATLTWLKSPLLTFYKQQLPGGSYKIIAVDSRYTSSIDLTTHTQIPPSQVNASHIELPTRVEVNRAFERLFGYSQSEIKHIFMREDSRGVLKLMDADSVRRALEYDTDRLATGQAESALHVSIYTKYCGPQKLRALLYTKKVLVGLALERKIYTWIPFPVETQPAQASR